MAQDSTSDRQRIAFLPDSAFTVDSVIISGNEHTEARVILREMTLKHGTRITAEAVQFDQSRIYGAGLFTEVEIFAEPKSADRANIVVKVRERWYLIPFPVLGIKDGDWNKAYYGLGLIHDNFRGRNEKVYIVGVLGYDPWGSLSYRNPFLDSMGAFYYEGRIGYNIVRNRSAAVLLKPTDAFDERHFSIASSVGKRLDNYNTVSVSAQYGVVDITDYSPFPTVSNNGIDRFFTFGVGYSYDTRDLGEYPSAGTFGRAEVLKYGFPGKELDNIRYSLDLREYVPLSERFVFASRISTNLLAGSRAPSYNHVYLGYDYRVRGHYRDVHEGENILGLSSELHYSLVPPVYIRVNFLPSAFGVWRFGAVFALFADAGAVWFRNNPVGIDSFVRGYGAGIHFLLPYSFVLRTEYALNELRTGQVIFDLGSAF